MMSNLFGLSDEQIARLRLFFPKSHGKPRVDDRRVLSGIIFINRNVLRWSDAPPTYGLRRRVTTDGNAGGEWLDATGQSAATNGAFPPG